MTNPAAILRDNLDAMDKGAAILSSTHEKCGHITQDNFTEPGNADRIELLTSRFARLSDLLIQKIFRTIDELELEEPGSPLDRINRAEKRGIIDSADAFVQIRVLRNEIAHEYSGNELWEIFNKAREYAPLLTRCAAQVNRYCGKYL